MIRIGKPFRDEQKLLSSVESRRKTLTDRDGDAGLGSRSVLIDERADERVREARLQIITGRTDPSSGRVVSLPLWTRRIDETEVIWWTKFRTEVGSSSSFGKLRK